MVYINSSGQPYIFAGRRDIFAGRHDVFAGRHDIFAGRHVYLQAGMTPLHVVELICILLHTIAVRFPVLPVSLPQIPVSIILAHNCLALPGDLMPRIRVGQNHTCIGIYGVCTVFLAGKSPYIRSCTVQVYNSGQPYPGYIKRAVDPFDFILGQLTFAHLHTPGVSAPHTLPNPNHAFSTLPHCPNHAFSTLPHY